MERGGYDDRILLAIDDITEREHFRRELEGQKAATETFHNNFQVDTSGTEGRMIYDLGNGQWDIPKLRDLLENVLPENDAFNDFEVEHEIPGIGRRLMVLNARRVDHLDFILLAMEDRTEVRRATAALEESEAKFRVLVETTTHAVWETDAGGAVVTDSPSWRAFTGQSPAEWPGAGWIDAVHPDDREAADRRWRENMAAERPVDAEFRLGRVDGGWRWAGPVRGENSRILESP